MVLSSLATGGKACGFGVFGSRDGAADLIHAAALVLLGVTGCGFAVVLIHVTIYGAAVLLCLSGCGFAAVLIHVVEMRRRCFVLCD